MLYVYYSENFKDKYTTCKDLKDFDEVFISKLPQIIIDGITIKANQTLSDYITHYGYDNTLEVKISNILDNVLEIETDNAVAIMVDMLRVNNADLENRIYNAENSFDEFFRCIDETMISIFKHAVSELEGKLKHIESEYKKNKHINYNKVY